MTEQERAKRKQLIVESAQKMQGKKEMTYWLTRGRDSFGQLSPSVDVWLIRPNLVDNGTRWEALGSITTSEGLTPVHYTQWTVDQCVRVCRTYPETERECIRVG